MLIVEAKNVYTDPLDRGNYRVNVWITDRPIWKGEVFKHPRSEGAAALLRRIAERMAQEEASQ